MAFVLQRFQPFPTHKAAYSQHATPLELLRIYILIGTNLIRSTGCQSPCMDSCWGYVCLGNTIGGGTGHPRRRVLVSFRPGLSTSPVPALIVTSHTSHWGRAQRHPRSTPMGSFSILLGEEGKKKDDRLIGQVATRRSLRVTSFPQGLAEGCR